MVKTGLEQNSSYMLSWAELTGLVLLYYLITWQIAPHAMQLHWLLLLGMVAAAGWIGYYLFWVSPVLHGDSPGARGLDSSTCKTSFVYYFVLLLIGLSVIVVMIYLKYGQRPPDIDWGVFWLKYGFYLTSAFLQDLIFFSFFQLRIKEIVSTHFTNKSEQLWITVGVVAVAFGLFHIPNWPLTLFSIGFGFLVSLSFYLRPNIWAVVLIHALLGTVLHRIYQLHMKIGLFYGQTSPDASFFRKIIPFTEALISDKW